jgi:hypothetical protein
MKVLVLERVLRFITSVDQAPHLFLPSQPSGTTGWLVG